VSSFYELDSTVLGEKGEEIAAKRLEKVGYTVAQFTRGISHPVDIVAYKRNKMTFFEIKTKAKMKYYDATGIDEADHETYTKLAEDYGVPVIILFVDYLTGSIYGGNIKDMQQHKKIPRLKANGKENRKVDLIVYDLTRMKEFCKLTEEEILELESLSNSNYKHVNIDNQHEEIDV